MDSSPHPGRARDRRSQERHARALADAAALDRCRDAFSALIVAHNAALPTRTLREVHFLYRAIAAYQECIRTLEDIC